MLIKNILLKKYENRERMRTKKGIRHVWARYEHLTLYEIMDMETQAHSPRFFFKGWITHY